MQKLLKIVSHGKYKQTKRIRLQLKKLVFVLNVVIDYCSLYLWQLLIIYYSELSVETGYRNNLHISVKNKTLGNWNNNGSCIGVGDDQTCGQGIQMQIRNCTDGTFDMCLPQDYFQNINCKLPPCTTTSVYPATGNSQTYYIIVAFIETKILLCV